MELDLNDAEVQWLLRFTKRFPTYTEAFKSYYSADDESKCLCPSCECTLEDYDWENKQFKHCPECGQTLISLDEYRESVWRAKEKSELKNKFKNNNITMLDKKYISHYKIVELSKEMIESNSTYEYLFKNDILELKVNELGSYYLFKKDEYLSNSKGWAYYLDCWVKDELNYLINNNYIKKYEVED